MSFGTFISALPPAPSGCSLSDILPFWCTNPIIPVESINLEQLSCYVIPSRPLAFQADAPQGLYEVQARYPEHGILTGLTFGCGTGSGTLTLLYNRTPIASAAIGSVQQTLALVQSLKAGDDLALSLTPGMTKVGVFFAITRTAS